MNSTLKLNLIRAISAIMLLFAANVAALVLFATLAMSIGFLRGKQISILSLLTAFVILAGYASSVILGYKIWNNKFSFSKSNNSFAIILIGIFCGLFLEHSVQHQTGAKIGLLYGTLEIPTLVVLVFAYRQTKFKIISRRA